ncbi:phage N-6-adenine-methyltransferase [Stenotrophomonas maltophilia]|uniref:phage N-6-adenine-methyltransferase n=1 Tax=Stenotrophomonas maltophilia TaxID=40324 RepID=UPI001F294929|nr:phage N-6-adenine-methyltransferase [Stenotrophomonas maltophilia]MCF3469348.1 adenine methyltransferase [Stenotrophomonas maltophilia]
MNAVARPLPVSTKPKKPAKKPKQTTLSLAVANNVGYDRAPEGITTETWLTPPEIVHGLGPFDLDPCIPQQGMPWRTATRMLKPSDDGLETPWPKSAFVWMNPPYGGHKNSPTSQHRWMEKAAEHGNGIALVLARMETSWMQDSVLNHPNVSAVVFTKGRLSFCRPDGTPGTSCPAGSVFIGYGAAAARRLKRGVESGLIRGTYLDMAHVSRVAGADVGAANDE